MIDFSAKMTDSHIKRIVEQVQKANKSRIPNRISPSKFIILFILISLVFLLLFSSEWILIVIALCVVSIFYFSVSAWVGAIETAGYKLACSAIIKGNLDIAFQYVFIRSHMSKFFRNSGSLYLTSCLLYTLGRNADALIVHRYAKERYEGIPELPENPGGNINVDIDLLLKLWE